jgi:hypothetical protein
VKLQLLFANKRFRRSRMRWRRTIFCFRNRPNRALSPFRFDMRLPSTRQCLKQVAGMLGYPSHSRATKRPSAPYAPPHGRRTLRRAKETLGGCSESQGFSGGDVRACEGRQEGAPPRPRGARGNDMGDQWPDAGGAPHRAAQLSIDEHRRFSGHLAIGVDVPTEPRSSVTTISS